MLKLPALRTLALLGVAGLALAAVPAANAHDDDDDKDSSEAEVVVIAQGLDNPRGLTVGPDGAVYVAEAGAGGAGPCFTSPEGRSCFGRTGAITRIDDDSATRVLKRLPSHGVEGTGDEGTGL